MNQSIYILLLCLVLKYKTHRFLRFYCVCVNLAPSWVSVSIKWLLTQILHTLLLKNLAKHRMARIKLSLASFHNSYINVTCILRCKVQSWISEILLEKSVWKLTSFIRNIWPLYVVRTVILSGEYPCKIKCLASRMTSWASKTFCLLIISSTYGHSSGILASASIKILSEVLWIDLLIRSRTSSAWLNQLRSQIVDGYRCFSFNPC